MWTVSRITHLPNSLNWIVIPIHSNISPERMDACHTPRFLLFDKAQAAIHLSVWQGHETCIIGHTLLSRDIGVTCILQRAIWHCYEQRQFRIEGRQINPFKTIVTPLHTRCNPVIGTTCVPLLVAIPSLSVIFSCARNCEAEKCPL